MNTPLVLVSGFGPFLTVRENPSGQIASLLERQPPAETEVRAVELPVSFERTTPQLTESMEQLSRRPQVLLGLGVHRKGYFRLERRARRVLDSAKPDSDGRFASSILPLGERDRVTQFEIERYVECLTSEDLDPVMISESAGGYVCERTYYALLEAGERLGVPALFLHVPMEDFLAVEAQAGHVRELIQLMLRDVERQLR